MGFSFSGIHEELSSHRFSLLYRELQAEFPPLRDYPDPVSLIGFFHDRREDYAPKDAILFFLVHAYRQGGCRRILSSFFIALFTPAIASIYRLARRRNPRLDDEEFIQEICAALLEIIQNTGINPSRVAVQIIGRLKNKARGVVNGGLQNARREVPESFGAFVIPDAEEFGGIPDGFRKPSAEPQYPANLFTDAGNDFEIADAEDFFDSLQAAGVITKEDRDVLTATIIEDRSLRAIAPDPARYQRLKKRRQRSLAAIRKYLGRP